MIVQCICNDGFEDCLEVGEFYQAESMNASYGIINEKGRFAWYGRDKFKPVKGTMI